jgi:hypothetical protein
MLLRASFLALVVLLGSLAAGCGHLPPAYANKLVVDTPALPYTAPDIDEITGIDSDAEEAARTEQPPKGTAPAPAPAPTPAPKK